MLNICRRLPTATALPRHCLMGKLLSVACATSPPAQVFCADGFEGNCGIPSFSANFSTDAASWPAPWIGVGGVALSDVQSGRARLRPVPSSYTLARMWAPLSTGDVEVRFALQIESVPSQNYANGTGLRRVH